MLPLQAVFLTFFFDKYAREKNGRRNCAVKKIRIGSLLFSVLIGRFGPILFGGNWLLVCYNYDIDGNDLLLSLLRLRRDPLKQKKEIRRK